MALSSGFNKAERYPRVKDWATYRKNWDAIFRKKKKATKKKSGKKQP